MGWFLQSEFGTVGTHGTGFYTYRVREIKHKVEMMLIQQFNTNEDNVSHLSHPSLVMDKDFSFTTMPMGAIVDRKKLSKIYLLAELAEA